MDHRRTVFAVIAALLASVALAATQGPPAYVYTGTAPSGACLEPRVWIDALGTGTWYCNAGTWTKIGYEHLPAGTTSQFWRGDNTWATPAGYKIVRTTLSGDLPSRGRLWISGNLTACADNAGTDTTYCDISGAPTVPGASEEVLLSNGYSGFLTYTGFKYLVGSGRLVVPGIIQNSYLRSDANATLTLSGDMSPSYGIPALRLTNLTSLNAGDTLVALSPDNGVSDVMTIKGDGSLSLPNLTWDVPNMQMRIGTGATSPITTAGGAELVVESASTTPYQWNGRAVVGGAGAGGVVFLMGQASYPNAEAWLGAHAGDLMSWADFRMNPDGPATVHIGALNQSRSYGPLLSINNTTNTSTFYGPVVGTTFTGDLVGNASTATALSTSDTTDKFWRADNTWAVPPAGGGGAGNFVRALVDFGTGGTTASLTITGQSWVASNSMIVCSPSMIATTSRAEGAEDSIVEGLVVAAHTKVVGTGFKVTAYAPFGTSGVHAVDCTGGAGTIASALVASLTDYAPYGSCNTGLPSCGAYSNTTTCSGSGGSGTYTYAWAKVSGDTMTIGAPSSATTDFYAGGLGVKTGVYRCTVTDTGTGATAVADATVTLENVGI